MKKKTVHIIIGPTASGKSSYALQYAKKNAAEIINADSMQIYEAFPILSAQPPYADTFEVPHHLYGFLKIQKSFNANMWAKEASKKIIDCWERNKLPLLVGGTGFYIQAILEGLSPIPDIPYKQRENIKQRLKEKGIESLHEELKSKDPLLAQKIKPTDIQRICRALEVFDYTGKPLSYWQKMPKKKEIEADFKVIEIRPDRTMVYQNIDNRVLAMIKNGAVDEVKKIKEKYPKVIYSGQKILGYQEICHYLEGDWSLDQSIEKLQQHSRNYAKRQMTWFRHQINADIVV